MPTNETIRRRVEALFHDALELHASARSSFVEEHCADDPIVRTEVMRLLAHADKPRISSLDAIDLIDDAETELVGERVGPYKLLELIGEGGFGSVYMADQQAPIRRRVALKIIKLGMDTKQVVARFEAERQALAMMDHSNIAKVFDAGATLTGRPYFVMELVRGMPITEFCDEGRLTVKQRLELMVCVCRAVQHAHQKGIIHRDIKPSNILVTFHEGVPVPKVIDFGIAKAMNEPLTDKTLFTAFRQFVGTPAYMSPEQAEMTDVGVDTRSDVYSLGVLLYELLTGTAPFDPRKLRSVGITELQRIIREDQPETPSKRLNTLGSAFRSPASMRGVDPPALHKLVAGELDWIVMKTLQKPQDRRYDSAGNLAADIERYMRNEPLAAGPISGFYLFRKMISRHRAAFGTLAAIILLLVGFGGWMGILYARTESLRREAQAARFHAEENLARAETAELHAAADAKSHQDVVELLSSTFELADSAGTLGKTVAVREILDQGLNRVETDLADLPRSKTAMLQVIGLVYYRLGLYEESAAAHRTVIDAMNRLRVSEPARLAASMNGLGAALIGLGDFKEAARILRDAQQYSKDTLGLDHPETIAATEVLAMALYSDGYVTEAEPLFREAIDSWRRTVGEDDDRTFGALAQLGYLLFRLHRFDEAEQISKESLDRTLKSNSGEDLSVAMSLVYHGGLLVRLGNAAEAHPLLERAEAIFERILGDNHVTTLVAMHNVGQALFALNQFSAAEQKLQTTIDLCVSVLGEDHPRTLRCRLTLGQLLIKESRLADAEEQFLQVLPRMDRFPSPRHPVSLVCAGQLASGLVAVGKTQQAESILRELVQLRREVLGEEHGDSLLALEQWANLATKTSAIYEAESDAREYIKTLCAASPKAYASIHHATLVLSRLLLNQGRFEDAEQMLLGLHSKTAGSDQNESQLVMRLTRQISELYQVWGKPELARQWATKVFDSPQPAHK